MNISIRERDRMIEIIVEDNKIKGIILEDGKEIYCDAMHQLWPLPEYRGCGD